MKTEIAKIKFRRGLETERQEVIFDEGEPAYTIDTKRLYIGDGTTPGGNALPVNWSANNLNKISNPIPNDLAFVNGVLYWYNQSYWQSVCGDNNGIGTNFDNNIFTTQTRTITSIDPENPDNLLSNDITEFTLKFRTTNNPITANGTGIYLNYSSNFTCYDNQLDIPFDYSDKYEGPIGQVYNEDDVNDKVLGTINGYKYVTVKPLNERGKNWYHLELFIDNTKLQYKRGTVKSLSTIPRSEVPSTIQEALTGELSSLPYVSFWYDKDVMVLTTK